MGNRNAAVFPLPVCAEAITSRPSSAGGIASAWMAVGRTKPSSLMALSSDGWSLRWLNGTRYTRSDACIDQRHESGGPHHSLAPVCVELGGGLRGLHLLERGPLGLLGADLVPDRRQHRPVFLERRPIAQRPVSGHDLRLVVDHLQGTVRGGDH